jgi:hypothetical protein
MKEDSGAFKTNPGVSRQIPAISICGDAGAPLPRSLTGAENAFRHTRRARRPRFNKRPQAVAVLLIEPDSLRWRCPPRHERGLLCGHRVPDSSMAFVRSREGGTRLSMLPGFRFLFAAVALSMSILVFGLGAVALLRAAHEEFASPPSWRAPPETMFAQPSETTRPVLALLRIDPPIVEQKPSDDIASVIPPAATPAETTAVFSTSAEPEPIAARNPEPPSSPEIADPETANSETSNSETPRSEIPIAEVAIQGELAPVQADPHAPVAETRIAANEMIASAPNEAAPTGSEPLSPPVSPDIASTKSNASTKIATLGGPSVTLETQPQPKASIAKLPDKNAVQKRLQARRAIQRRKLALRARLARQAQQQPADPFAQPVAQPVAPQVTTARKR